MGKVFKWTFVAFNILMGIWVIGGWNAATKGYENMSSAEQAGTAIGTGIGMALVLGIWVIGAILLGMFVLFTRPKAG